MAMSQPPSPARHSGVDATTSAEARNLLRLLERGVPEFPTRRTFDSIRISGADIRALMRRHDATLRQIAQDHNLTVTRVRQWRDEGLEGFCAVNAVWCITGVWIA